VHVLGETRLEAILDAATRQVEATVLILDSIQTVYTDCWRAPQATWARCGSAPRG
jgi:predicted ATP-dependent serine protease